MPTLDDDAKRALAAAVRSVENKSSAEIVISVRPQSDSYLAADLLAAVAGALAALAFLLFSPWDFGIASFIIDPLIAGLAAGIITSRLPALQRLLTPRGRRRDSVTRGARAAFLDKRVHTTARRTGILVYISILEREVDVVTDIGVEPVAASPPWREAVRGIESALRRNASGVDLASTIEALGAVLGPALPRSSDDVNELPDEVEGS